MLSSRNRTTGVALRRTLSLVSATAVLGATLMAGSVPAWAVDTDHLNITFGGTFANDTYTTGGNEVAKGKVTAHGTAPTTVDGGGIHLAGGTNGVQFESNTEFGTGGNATTGFRAELEYQTSKTPGTGATIFSAFGNIFVREAGGKLEYGFSSLTNNKWNDHKTQIVLPPNSVKHILQLAYTPAASGSTLQLSVDGTAGPTVTSGANQYAAIGTGLSKRFGIGYEVNTAASAANRGFEADMYRVRIAPANAAWEYLDATQLMGVDFLGSFNGTTYTKSGDEQMLGTLTSRTNGLTITDSAVTLPGDTAGLEFAPTGFSLGDGTEVTKPMVAELRFTPTKTDSMQTLFSAGGNLFVRYEANGSFVYGISVQSNGKWTDHKITAAAPAGEEHVVSVAYVPKADGTTKLVMRVDDGDVQTKDVQGKAALNADVKDKVGIGNEMHTADNARKRGFVGTIGEVRLAETSAAFTDKEFRLVYTPVDCDTSGISPANTFEVTPAECTASLKAKLSALRPTEEQADYIDWGRIGFMHYGVNTYTGNDWGDGDEDPKIVDPTDLDTDQWARSFADAGFKMLMVTVKHHDGFELYDSRYNTEHDWANTAVAEKTGEKDLFRKIVNSARKYGIKIGIYYSPADSYMEKQGVWGNDSARVKRTIPTLVENDDRAQKVADGTLPTFEYEATDYGAYMLNQLYELLTEYGDIAEVWFDGAQGNTAGTEHYDYGVFYDMIRKLQPTTIQANAAYDARWVGNEDGWARETEWSPQAAYNDGVDKVALKPSQMAKDGVLGSMSSVLSEIRSGSANQLHWYPAEVDVKNSPGGWFHKDNGTPSDVNTLLKYYEQSTGRNSQYLLNVPPAKSGKLADADVAVLQDMTKELEKRYGTDLALGRDATVAAVTDGEAVAAPKLTDGSKLSSDEAVGNTPTYTVELGSATAVDAVRLGEDVRNAGQQVESFVLEGRVNGEWQKLYSGTATTIGQQRNLRFAVKTVDAVRVRITASRGPVRLSRLEVFHYQDTVDMGARKYYIDPTADKAGDGRTEQTPMTSIEQLHDVTVPAGSTILIKAGTTLTGDFGVFGYGTEDKPITVTSYGEGTTPKASFTGMDENMGFKAVLDQLGKTDAGWTTDLADPDPDPDPEPGPGEVGKDKLNAEIAAGDGLVAADYTADSWAAYQAALAQAREISAKADATQSDIDAALTKLAQARKALVKQGADAKPDTKPDTKPDKKKPTLSNTGATVATALVAALVTAAGGVSLRISRRRR